MKASSTTSKVSKDSDKLEFIRCYSRRPCGARASLFVKAQSIIPFKAGRKDSPSSVKLYSTLGGTSAYTLRVTRRKSSRRLSVWESIFLETSGMSFWKSRKRHTPYFCMATMAKTDHLSPIWERMSRTGQKPSKFAINLSV